MPSYDISKRAAEHSPAAFALLLSARELRRAKRSLLTVRDTYVENGDDVTWLDIYVLNIIDMAARIDIKRRRLMGKPGPKPKLTAPGAGG